MAEPIYIHPAEARRRFRDFAAAEILPSMLAEGALLIALEDYPRLDIEHYRAQLEALVRRVAAAEGPEVFRLGHIHREMFDVDGYRGNQEEYYDIRNSYLNEVVDRRLGIPITLSVIYLYVAQAVGLHAVGVGLPGHYIVKVQFDLSEVYVDPFHEGRSLTVADIDRMLSEMSNGRVRLRSEHLRGWTPRETLMRVLANLQASFQRMDDRRRAQAAHERIEILAAGAPVDRRE